MLSSIVKGVYNRQRLTYRSQIFFQVTLTVSRLLEYKCMLFVFSHSEIFSLVLLTTTEIQHEISRRPSIIIADYF